jgi:hypothetical protein
VGQPDDVALQAEGLLGVVDTFLEYVGRRTVRQVGHNFTWVMADTSERRGTVLRSFVPQQAMDQLLNVSTDVSADLSFTFHRGSESRTTVRLGMSAPADIALEFNFHYELADLDIDAQSAVQHLDDSYRSASEIVGNLEAMLGQNETVGA